MGVAVGACVVDLFLAAVADDLDLASLGQDAEIAVDGGHRNIGMIGPDPVIDIEGTEMALSLEGIEHPLALVGMATFDHKNHFFTFKINRLAGLFEPHRRCKSIHGQFYAAVCQLSNAIVTK